MGRAEGLWCVRLPDQDDITMVFDRQIFAHGFVEEDPLVFRLHEAREILYHQQVQVK